MDYGGDPMPLRIRVTGSAVADDLVAFLRQLGADARKEGASVYVTRRHRRAPAEPPDHDRMELEFVVRVWASERRRHTAFKVEEAA
jgi:hypothetical protein